MSYFDPNELICLCVISNCNKKKSFKDKPVFKKAAFPRAVDSINTLHQVLGFKSGSAHTLPLPPVAHRGTPGPGGTRLRQSEALSGAAFKGVGAEIAATV